MPIDLFVRVTVVPLLKGNWTMQEAKKLGKLRFKFAEISEQLSREFERIIHKFMEQDVSKGSDT